jgi:hypothetical protein
VGDGILNDEGFDAIRVSERHPKADWSAVILHVKGSLSRRSFVMAQFISYRTVKVDGLSIFYREAGPKNAPTLPTILASGTAMRRRQRSSRTPSTTSPR